MIRNIGILSSESFLLLRRDRVFMPIVFAFVLVAVFANIASDWSVEDFSKILLDIGTLGFQLTGSVVAIFWGVRLLATARTDGSIEAGLTAPVSRTSWLIGKYLGLALSLALVGILMIVFWQILLFINEWGVITQAQLILFLFLFISWLVMGACSLFLATFTSPGLATFASLTLWLVGNATHAVASTLRDDAPSILKSIVLWTAKIWDLQLLNLVQFATVEPMLPTIDLYYRASYGILLILLFLTTACLVFNNRDIT